MQATVSVTYSSMLSYYGVHAVRAYQRFLSPHKGFRCACAVLTNGPSCSAFALDELARLPFFEALASIWQRLGVCREVYSAYSKGVVDAAVQRTNRLPAVVVTGGALCCPPMCTKTEDPPPFKQADSLKDVQSTPKNK